MGQRMSGLARLGDHVARSLDDVRERHDGASRVRSKIAAGAPLSPRRAPSLRLRKPAALGAFATAAAILLAVAFFARGRLGEERPASLSFVVSGNAALPPEPGVVGTFLAAPDDRAMPLSFSDGTELRLAPHARARVAEVTHDGARVLLESGALHASVVHRDGARWVVGAGPFEVLVTGTRFDVAWEPAAEAIVVTLHEGSVVVTGCELEGGRRVVAGERIEASCKAPSAPTETAVVEASPTPVAAAPAEAASQARAVVPNAPSRSPHEVAARLRKGAHREAMSAAEDAGFESTCDTLSASDLLLLADAARYAGRFPRADQALLAVRRRFAGSDAAAKAAFELGRIAFDVNRDHGRAGDWFDAYLGERPSGPLAREALGRALESRHRAGDATRAERLAVRYLARYPDGPHATLARRLARRGGE
jgi:transmembrane sensor